MRLVQHGETVSICELDELSAHNAAALRSKLSSLPGSVREVEIDMGTTAFVDCHGLGALLALETQARAAGPELKLSILNPRQSVRRILQLTGFGTALSAQSRVSSALAEDSSATSRFTAALAAQGAPLQSPPIAPGA